MLLCSTAVGCAQARQALTAPVLLLFTSIHFSALPFACIMFWKLPFTDLNDIVPHVDWSERGKKKTKSIR